MTWMSSGKEPGIDWLVFDENDFVQHMEAWMAASIDQAPALQPQGPEILELCRDRWRAALGFARDQASSGTPEEQVRYVAYVHASARVVGYLEGIQAYNTQPRSPN